MVTRDTPVQQGLNHICLQHSGFLAKGGGNPIIQIRAEPFDACLHETGPLVDFKRKVSVFVVSAA